MCRIHWCLQNYVISYGSQNASTRIWFFCKNMVFSDFDENSYRGQLKYVKSNGVNRSFISCFVLKLQPLKCWLSCSILYFALSILYLLTKSIEIRGISQLSYAESSAFFQIWLSCMVRALRALKVGCSIFIDRFGDNETYKYIENGGPIKSQTGNGRNKRFTRGNN